MGKELADSFPEAAHVFQEADEILDFGLSDLCWGGPEEELTLTKNAQPAILVHSVAVFRVLEERLGPISMAAGHSLGEFSAHVAAGTISFPDALASVRRRGELMFASGEERPGTMAAVLGMDDEALEALCREVSTEGSVCVPANFNSAGQVVISGDVEAVQRAMAAAGEAGARRVVPLNVSGAFHSPLMATAEAGLRAHLDSVPFAQPRFPVVSNVSAAPVSKGPVARDLLVRQLTSPVRWTQSVAAMLAAGVDRFLELGPGNVLCGLNRRNARGIPCASVGGPGDMESLDHLNPEES
jgi:[acyl-carrier-protein] S-malonyltransferase